MRVCRLWPSLCRTGCWIRIASRRRREVRVCGVRTLPIRKGRLSRRCLLLCASVRTLRPYPTMSCLPPLGIVNAALVRVGEDLVGCLNALKLGVEFYFLAWVAIWVIQSCYRVSAKSLQVYSCVNSPRLRYCFLISSFVAVGGTSRSR